MGETWRKLFNLLCSGGEPKLGLIEGLGRNAGFLFVKKMATDNYIL
jgi:hypothetical protein